MTSDSSAKVGFAARPVAPASKEIRDKYVDITNMFKLMGEPPREGRRRQNGDGMETALAGGLLAPADMRDPEKIYQKVAELGQLTPASHPEISVAICAPKVKAVNVAEPEFAKTMQRVIDEYSVDDLKGRSALRFELLASAKSHS